MRLYSGLHIFLAVVLASPSAGNGQEWQEPYFLKPENLIPEVEYFNETFPMEVIISMDEEIPANQTHPVYLTKLNYAGPKTPMIAQTTSNTSGAYHRKVGEEHYVVITKVHDFENLVNPSFNIKIWIDSQEGEIYLNIINIDDNPPMIEIKPCEIEELYVGPSDCVFNVYDADGAISTSNMMFNIEGSEEDKRTFHVEQKPGEDQYNLWITLHTKRPLDYFLSQLHIFTIVATDSGPNNGTATAIVQVIDMPNMPPTWKQIFAMQTFDEKTEQVFYVKAVDGDTGINTEINYRIETNMPQLFSIDPKNGTLYVEPINRDALKREVFNLDIIAFKANNESSVDVASVVIIVNDVNDNLPVVKNGTWSSNFFNSAHFSLTIEEETYMSLAFDPPIFIEDIDLGENAQYAVELRSVSPPRAKEAFLVVPNEGYQEQAFQITIVNASLLDFDTEEWQVVEFEIVATEIYRSNHTGSASITINLKNWNDELPIFNETSVEVWFNETVEKGYAVETLRAYDRDIGDRVVHSLAGGADSFLSIDSETGEIVVGKDDAFDYQRQSEILVQVKAEDTLGHPYHAAYAQLTIRLFDVNNKPPEIRLPRVTPSVEENVLEGHLITDEITGSDPDSTANIVFSIDWDETYASKQGRPTPREKFEGCVTIETNYTKGTREAKGVVKATGHDNIIDFEEFEVLYLAIGLTDTMQEIGDGYAKSTLTITIIDLNDNAPEWTEGTLETLRYVREEARSGAVIGNVLATDIDGPDYNKVTYLIDPIGDTPPELVKIDKDSGQITVDADEKIDADVPMYFLYYNVTATDCEGLAEGIPCFNTVGSIEINITDTNNKDPKALEDEFLTEVEIFEHEQTGYKIECVKSKDLDRDEMYHKVTYAINSLSGPDVRKFFDVDFEDGCLYVRYTTDEELDRDNNDTPYYTIYITLSDNQNVQGDRVIRTNLTSIHVILLDINDNAPQLPPPSEEMSWRVSEDEKKGFLILPNITAPDIDDPATDNAKVRYEVLDLTNADSPDESFYMIDILSPDNVSGILVVKEDLKGLWGSYKITLMAIDWGVPPMNTTETYDLTVTPYNYMTPEITFPVEGSKLRLSRESAFVGVILQYANQNALDPFDAVDEDGLEAGEVTFEIAEPDEAVKMFTLKNIGANKAHLMLSEPLGDRREFNIVARATDHGTDPHARSSDVRFSVSFVSTTGYPTFPPDSAETVRFKEFEEGLKESFPLMRATDDKNDGCVPGENCFDIFYHLMEGDADLFRVDSTTNAISLSGALNRTEKETHALKIMASNSESKPGVEQKDSLLTVVVQVREANPRPVFGSSLYTAGISVADDAGKSLLTLKASHTERSAIAYEIMTDTMKVDESMESVKDNPFELNAATGELKLNFQPKSSMQGMLEFAASATDEEGARDETEVKVFLIAENIRMSFTFNNRVQDVEEKRADIVYVLTKTFEYTCVIDKIMKADKDGVPLDDKSEVLAYFVDESLPVSPEVIEEKKADMLLMKAMEAEFLKQGLALEDFSSTIAGPSAESAERMLKIALVVVSTVLTVVCLALMLAYYFRTKSLSDRLKVISEANFGSVDSNMNRIGVGVPGTNKHAIEGSNPVWNDDKKTSNLDAVSEASGDSDLVGIEDDPQFKYDDYAERRF